MGRERQGGVQRVRYAWLAPPPTVVPRTALFISSMSRENRVVGDLCAVAASVGPNRGGEIEGSKPRRISPRRGWFAGLILCAPTLVLGSACRVNVHEEMLSDQPAAVQPDPASVTLGPNDILHVGVFGHPELSSPDTLNGYGSRIDPAGCVNLPLVGAVHVAGLGLEGATVAVTEAFSAFVQEPRVHVTLVEWGSRRFYVYGEVQKPGPQVLDRPLNAYQGLSLAGGFTRSANREDIWLLRPDPPAAPERYLAYAIDGESPSDGGLATLQPDDVLFVRRSGAGRFADEVLPVLSGVSSSLSSVATVLLIEDRLNN